MGIGSIRNKNCWCGSGLKYKKCHLFKDNARNMEEVRQAILREQSNKILNKMIEDSQKEDDSPHDLGVHAVETIKTAEHMGP